MVDGQAGKGSKYRPVDQKKYDENWEKAFGSKRKKNSKKGQMQPGGIYDTTDIPQSEDTNEKDKQT
jgi:hypothetical protein